MVRRHALRVVVRQPRQHAAVVQYQRAGIGKSARPVEAHQQGDARLVLHLPEARPEIVRDHDGIGEQFQRLRNRRGDEQRTPLVLLSVRPEGDPAATAPRHPRHGHTLVHVQTLGQVLRYRGHAGGTPEARASVHGTLPATACEAQPPPRGRLGVRPSHHVAAESLVADREVLRAVVEDGPVETARRHAPAKAAPFVDHRDAQAVLRQHPRGHEAGDAAADDQDTVHTAARPSHLLRQEPAVQPARVPFRRARPHRSEARPG